MRKKAFPPSSFELVFSAPLRTLCLSVCSSISSMLTLTLITYPFAFKPSHLHKAVVLVLYSFLSLFWYCLTQHPYHPSLLYLYCTLGPEGLHIKIINNVLPSPKAHFNHANLEFLKFWLSYWSCSLCFYLVYIYDTKFSWVSKFSHSFSSESNSLTLLFFSQDIHKELLTFIFCLDLSTI